MRNAFARRPKWLDKGKTIEIIKRGKHVADLVPKAGGKRKGRLGCTPSPYPIPADIDDPVEVQWEAML